MKKGAVIRFGPDNVHTVNTLLLLFIGERQFSKTKCFIYSYFHLSCIFPDSLPSEIFIVIFSFHVQNSYAGYETPQKGTL